MLTSSLFNVRSWLFEFDEPRDEAHEDDDEEKYELSLKDKRLVLAVLLDLMMAMLDEFFRVDLVVRLVEEDGEDDS
jgi:hypothetical protein